MLLIADSNSDERRDLIAFRPPSDFPQATEAKMLSVKNDGTVLGNHAHPHAEGFFLVSGSCLVRTWTKTNGVKERELSAPVMFYFEPEEEHALICSKGTIIVGYMPTTFTKENNTPATHL